MDSALANQIGPFIPLGGIVGAAVLCAVIWAVCRCCRDGAKDGCGGGVSATGKHEGLLDKTKDVVVAVPEPSGGGQQRGDPGGDGDGDVELCAICKAPLAEEGWGGCRRLRPCGHVYHVDCVGLWLQRRWVCPVCRADVAVSPTEIMDAIV
ncbi:hypothetical protein SETIT_5G363700v2 [Setaria italica]|uniref:RING-type E3 ubiquitin transferase n=2 Tax=Setaria italica TaxID=4555 RepID=A0A368RCK7_SETIT|nr:E3 ubiquitin-protein ligase EL5 [Setaria italica]RCV27916.1 hypothetical protein SETIT_5G363700v2 [Setaria italica]